MRKKFAKAVSVVMLMTIVSGCGESAPMQSDRVGQNQAVGGEGEGNWSGDAGEANLPGDSAEAGDGSQSGKPQPMTNSTPERYSVDEIYTTEASILPITESASAWGISYKIENVEYTDSFGDRDLNRLELHAPGAETDSRGTLSEGFQYLFLTITFTNTADQTQEITRNSNGISVIGASLNTISWATDSCYYDVDWEKGRENQKHHWVLEPGESVTSEVGWVIPDCENVLAEDDTLNARMGSGGPYELYYHVKQYDGDNEGSSFIDLGVKAE